MQRLRILVVVLVAFIAACASAPLKTGDYPINPNNNTAASALVVHLDAIGNGQLDPTDPAVYQKVQELQGPAGIPGLFRGGNQR